MNFKRPSFKRGGPTGIAQLTPRRQGYAGGGNIGGGIISGSNLGTRSGFMSPSSFPGFEFLESGVQNELRSQMSQPSGKGLTRGSNLTRLGLKTLRNFPKTSTAGLMSLPFVLPAGLAYMNKPETLAEKKVMQDYGMIDETFFDYDKMYADREAASKVGDKISFSDALFMDPETGQYPKFFGRTDDRNKRAQIEKDQIEEAKDINIDMRGDPAQFTGEDEVTDFDAIVEKMVSNKKTDTETDDKPEPTFEDTYQTEFDRIQKLIGDDNTKGMAAIALSEAIGTPGTIADKAAVLNKSLVALMGNKKKDKKEIAMLAYKATKEIEKAKIAAGKQTDSAKNFEELKSLNRIIYDDTGTYNEEQKKNAQSRLNIIEKSIRVLNPQKESGLNTVGAKLANTMDVLAARLAGLNKDSPGYKKTLDKYIRARALALKDPLLQDYILVTDMQTGLQFKKDGGRIGLANGSPIEQITETETVETSGTPTVQVTRLSFEELRDRLPPEVTDDVIRFLSQSEQALQDFAYIRTAGDIKKFNMKYGLNLVLPAQA